MEPLRFNVNADGRPVQGLSSAPVSPCPVFRFSVPLLQRDELNDKGSDEKLRQEGATCIPPDAAYKHTSLRAESGGSLSLRGSPGTFLGDARPVVCGPGKASAKRTSKQRAGKLGLDTDAFNKCLDGKRYATQVREDVRAGSSAGVDGTPALFVNGRYLNGNRPYEDIADLIDEELGGK